MKIEIGVMFTRAEFQLLLPCVNVVGSQVAQIHV